VCLRCCARARLCPESSRAGVFSAGSPLLPMLRSRLWCFDGSAGVWCWLLLLLLELVLLLELLLELLLWLWLAHCKACANCCANDGCCCCCCCC
jgi:hypothetical protein